MPRTIKIVTGTSDFRKMVLESDVFVDKSLLIQEVLDSGDEAVLITRPRRWGKSINLDMLQKFIGLEVDKYGNKLAVNPYRVLFEGGDAIISDEEKKTLKTTRLGELENKEKYFKYQGKHPVIKFDFKDVALFDNPLEIAKAIRDQYLDITRNYKLNSENLKLKDFQHELADISDKLSKKQKETDDMNSRILSITQQILEGDNTLAEQQAVLERQQAALREDRVELREDRAALEKQQAALENEFNKDISTATRYIEEMGKSLCRELYTKYNQKVFVLIDEYDATINNNYDKANFDDITALIRGIFTSLIKDNDNLEKAILTGILRVAKANLFSGLNNVAEYGVLDDKFASHYGFTEEEVRTLLNAKWLDEETLTQRTIEAKEWYNGYTMGKVLAYNPWSIARYFNNDNAEPYWVESGSDKLLRKSISDARIHLDLMALRDGKSLEVELDKQANFDDIRSKTPKAVYSLLIHAGYLTLESIGSSSASTSKLYKIRLPNTEVIDSFSKLNREWVQSEVSKLGNSDQILKEIHDSLSDQSLFQKKVKELILDKLPDGEKTEAYFQALIGGMIEFYSFMHHGIAKHKVLVEKTVAKGGRIDNIFYPKVDNDNTPVIIHEYKQLQKTTKDNVPNELEAAFWQILEKKYLEEPLSKKQYHQDSHKWENIKLRSVVFVKDETTNKWSVHLEEREISSEGAEKIAEAFSKNPAFSKIKQTYGAKNAYDLVDKISTQPSAKKARVDKDKSDDVHMVDASGSGSILCEELSIPSYYSKYYGNGLDNILSLRLIEEGIEDTVKLSYSILSDGVDFDLQLVKAALLTKSTSVIKPYNIDYRHWVGVAFLLENKDLSIEYIDSENNPMPEILKKGILRVFPSSKITENAIIPEVDNCCGAEVVEGLIKSLGGKSISTKAAVLHHMQLIENSWFEAFHNNELKAVEDTLHRDLTTAVGSNKANFQLSVQLTSTSIKSNNLLNKLDKYIESLLVRCFHSDSKIILEEFAAKRAVVIDKSSHEWERGVYKELTLKLHPDKGGSKEEFQKLQNIYTKVTEKNGDISHAEITEMYKTVGDAIAKANVVIKGADTALDGIKLWQEQDINHGIKLATSVTQLYGMATNNPSISLGLGAVETILQIHSEDYIGAMQTATITVGYTLGMVALSTTFSAIATATSIGLTTYSACSVVYKGYEMLSGYMEIQPTEMHSELFSINLSNETEL